MDPAGGPDLLLDGAGQGLTDTVLTESGIERSSPNPELFTFTNTGGGSLLLRVQGQEVVTTATDMDTLSDLACLGGQVAKSAGGGWTCGTDDDTTYSAGNQLTLTSGTLNVTEGAGSGLDADTVDGLDSLQIIAQAIDETRTEITSLPITISQSGSYYVGGNLTTNSSLDGIRITAAHVTLDLGGFTLNGNAVGNQGIDVSASDVEIRNGSIRNFIEGIDVSFSGRGVRLIDLRVEDNSEIGIDILGEGSLIDRCTVADNGSTASHHGIDITSSALITRSVIRQNAGHGIRGASSATLNIVDNVVEDNTGSGISTFNALVIQNTVQDNGGRGIDASNGCTVRNNAVFSNGLSGIRTFAECVVQSNAVRGNNDTETAGEAGIWASSATLAADNVVGSNGLSNIQVSGSDSVIERNLMARCLVLGSGCTGLLITSGGNFYADNRLRGHNTNLDIAASNTDGGGNVTF